MAKAAGPAFRLARNWLTRRRLRAPLLVAFALLLGVLLAVGQLAAPGALVLLVVGLAAAALLGKVADTEVTSNAVASQPHVPESELRLFADALPDPCIVLDARSAVLHCNGPAAAQFPGLVKGRPLSLSLRVPVLLGAIETVRSSGTAETVEMHQTLPTETWHRVTVAPLAPADGGGELVVTLRSLTDEKRLATLRTDFIANASHELRTPLTSVLGFIDTLTGPAANDPEAQRRFLAIMRSQAVRMSRLIDDLLSLSRIEMRQHLRPTGSVDLGALLREVREGLSAQAAEAGVSVELALPEAPVVVAGDREELYEVFQNLLENAFKYGADGGRVEVALGPANRSGFAWLVSVTDHGEGIAPQHVPRLTERFYRVDAESSRKKKGTGLGLAIVKHILTRHHGQLAIRSRLGEGTRVEVLLPG